MPELDVRLLCKGASDVHKQNATDILFNAPGRFTNIHSALSGNGTLEIAVCTVVRRYGGSPAEWAGCSFSTPDESAQTQEATYV